LVDVATALARAGHHQDAAEVAASAERIARSIADATERADALGGIAVALAEAGDHEQAADVARTIDDDPYSQGMALAGIATALARAGRQQEAAEVADSAERIAHSITDPDQQSRTLVGVATALAQTGDANSAWRVAAATCAAGQWTTAVRPVLLLAPSAFTTLARMLEEQ